MSAVAMSALRTPLRRAASENYLGNLGIVSVQNARYSTEERKVNMASWKRGTGGRSSFNGIVATVFGCTGFVGRALCNRLGKIGTQLILPYRCDHTDCINLKVVGDLGQVLFHEFDLRDEKSIETAVKYSNVVFNLIGREHETMNFKYEDVHVKGARAIARACRKAGVDRLIHMSSLNSDPNPEPLAMSTPSRLKITRWQGEQAVLEEFPDATIIKASDIYGSGDRFVEVYVHPWRRLGKTLALWGNGELTEKQPVFVSDVAQGLVNAARDPDARGQIYQAIGPRRYKLSEMMDYFYRLMRRDADWGYVRYDSRKDPFFKLRVTLNEKFSPAHPIGFLHWEGIEKEATSDKVMQGVPTLEDLGVNLTLMETQMPWLLKPYRAYNYYNEKLGDIEFQKPYPPPYINTQTS